MLPLAAAWIGHGNDGEEDLKTPLRVKFFITVEFVRQTLQQGVKAERPLQEFTDLKVHALKGLREPMSGH